MEMNEVLGKLPKHLMGLVIDQPYHEYTSQDQAIWRYVMRRNVDYLKHVAHHSYVDGLRQTGISIESIPHMYGMNRILKEIGWAAVAVDGFIPPAAFMEFQSYQVLVIAADIRPINQLEYTPAPDIIHEAAGHAPILADPEYAEYLKNFGKIGTKAFSSSMDYTLYEAIRHLSILKADPYTPREEIEKAAKRIIEIENTMGDISEMAMIRNLHWWTVEYGLIGDIKNPKIYGAGLLSSIGESYSALQDEVIKIPYTIKAKQYPFDITKKQPQLFVTPDFKTLNRVLNEFADTMALRQGGKKGLHKAIASGTTATAVYKSGLQVSGVFSEIIEDRDQVVYLKTKGPTQLSCNNKELAGHGKSYHAHGFGSPVGKLKNTLIPLENLADSDLENLGICLDKETELNFESGVTVHGALTKIKRDKGNLLLLTFTNCRVQHRGQVLFDPSWGIFDMAVGEEIISVYNGPADADAFGLAYPAPSEKTHKIKYSLNDKNLHELYAQARKLREINNTERDVSALACIWKTLQQSYPSDWLLPLEIMELLERRNSKSLIRNQIFDYLETKKTEQPQMAHLISNGLKLIGQ